MPYDVQDTAARRARRPACSCLYFAPDGAGGRPELQRQDDLPGNNYLPDKTGTTWSGEAGQPGQVHAAVASARLQPAKPAMTVDAKAHTVRLDAEVSSGGPNDGCDLTTVLRLTNRHGEGEDQDRPDGRHREHQRRHGHDVGLAHRVARTCRSGDGVALYEPRHAKKIMVVLTDGDNTNSTTGTANGNNSTYSGLGYIWQNRIGVNETSTAAERTTAMDGRHGRNSARTPRRPSVAIYACGSTRAARARRR